MSTMDFNITVTATDLKIINVEFPSNGLSPYGLEAQSIAFFRTPGTEKLYSDVAIRIASASLIFVLNFCSIS